MLLCFVLFFWSELTFYSFLFMIQCKTSDDLLGLTRSWPKKLDIIKKSI